MATTPKTVEETAATKLTQNPVPYWLPPEEFSAYYVASESFVANNGKRFYVLCKDSPIYRELKRVFSDKLPVETPNSNPNFIRVDELTLRTGFALCNVYT